MGDGTRRKDSYLWAIAALVILFIWWPRTIKTLVIDLVALALCIFLAVRAKRES